jgi:hypothetical protein
MSSPGESDEWLVEDRRYLDRCASEALSRPREALPRRPAPRVRVHEAGGVVSAGARAPSSSAQRRGRRAGARGGYLEDEYSEASEFEDAEIAEPLEGAAPLAAFMHGFGAFCVRHGSARPPSPMLPAHSTTSRLPSISGGLFPVVYFRRSVFGDLFPITQGTDSRAACSPALPVRGRGSRRVRGAARGRGCGMRCRSSMQQISTFCWTGFHTPPGRCFAVGACGMT